MANKNLVSDCCGASPKGNGDCDTSDFGICPECGEHCEYVYEDDEDDEDFDVCDECDNPDACGDFGCAIKTGVRKFIPLT